MIGRILGGGIARKLLTAAIPALALAGAGWWLVSLIQENRDLEHTVAAYEASMEAQREALADAERRVSVLSAARAEAERRAATFRDIREDLADAPQSADGDVAPVLRDALERLRERAAGQDQAGQTGGASGDADTTGSP